VVQRADATQVEGRIIAKHYRYGFDEFWRHTAANISFREIGSHWYLQVIPKYFFTSDGDTPYDNEKVGPYTTRIRARERNYHVLNQVLFWADVLAAGSDSIQLRLDRRVLVDIAREPMTGIAPFAIPLDPAIYEEPDEVDELGQTSLFDILVGDPRPAEGDEEQDDEESDDYLN